MAQLGADVDQMDALSNRFREASGQLQGIMAQIGNQLDGVWWQGSDADNFRAQWQGEFRSQLQTMCGQFEQIGTSVKAQADHQRQASGA